MGMGRTGAAAYERLQKQGYKLIALDSDPGKVDKHRKAGRNILFADAEDQAFWQGPAPGTGACPDSRLVDQLPLSLTHLPPDSTTS